MHYYTRMIPKLTDTPEPLFNSLYPHLNTASGVQPLTWLRIKSELKVESEVCYVLHLLNAHDGEARFVGDPGWYEFPASGGVQPCNARFWSYQFVQTYEIRKYLYDRSEEEGSERDLTWEEIRWIMRVEGGETKVLKWLADPASGGYCWYMKCGNYITLAELFHLGIHLLSCYDLYRAYRSLPIFIHKRVVSQSHSAEAQC